MQSVQTVRSPAASGSDDLQPDIADALRALSANAHVDVAFCGLTDEDGALRLTHFVGANTTSLHGLKVDLGLGLGGMAAIMRRPVTVSDYPHHRGITHDYDVQVLAAGLRSMTAVPIVIQGNFRGVIYGAIRQPLILGDRTISAVVAAGRQIEQNAVLRIAKRSARHDAVYPEAAAREALRAIKAELASVIRLSNEPAVEERINVIRARIDQMLVQSQDTAPTELSPREYDVIVEVANGLTNRAVAERLGLEAETVKSYLRNAMRKLGCHTRLQAINEARRRGWLDW